MNQESSDRPAAISVHRVDLGFQRPVSHSSSYSPELDATELRPAAFEGEVFFHTGLEDHPWIIVDLQRPRLIGEITIWNREGSIGILDRAVPLSVSVSDDGEVWRAVSVFNRHFRGRRSGRPLTFIYPRGLPARYVKLLVMKETYLHFDYIEIMQYFPMIDYGSIVNLRYAEDEELRCDYLHLDNNGLYANFSSILADVIKIAQSNISVERIDATRGFLEFKNHLDEDVFPKFCDTMGDGLIDACKGLQFEAPQVHGQYKTMPLDRLQAVIAIVFAPSEHIKLTIANMIASSGIVPERTIALIYRGTDKAAEVDLAPVQEYIRLCKTILAEHPDHHVFIQTDQEQARDDVVAAFPGNCGYFCELPVTRGNKVMHHLQFGDEIAMTREEFSLRMIAATMILARCAYVINHTGNTAAWIAFYRGSSENLFQFDATGQLIEP